MTFVNQYSFRVKLRDFLEEYTVQISEMKSFNELKDSYSHTVHCIDWLKIEESHLVSGPRSGESLYESSRILQPGERIDFFISHMTPSFQCRYLLLIRLFGYYVIRLLGYFLIMLFGYYVIWLFIFIAIH